MNKNQEEYLLAASCLDREAEEINNPSLSASQIQESYEFNPTVQTLVDRLFNEVVDDDDYEDTLYLAAQLACEKAGLTKVSKVSKKRIMVKYRFLEEGEIIKKGDQWKSISNGVWRTVCVTIGLKAPGVGLCRRRYVKLAASHTTVVVAQMFLLPLHRF